MTAGYLTSGVLMGLLAVTVVVLARGVRRWRSYSPRVVHDTGGKGLLESGLLPAVDRTWTVIAVGYVALSLLVAAGTVATLAGALGLETFLLGLGVVFGCLALAAVYVTEPVRRAIVGAGYRLKKTVSFRGRPLWSMLVGWATVLFALAGLGAVFLAAWFLAGGSVAFLAALFVPALVLAAYLVSTVGVSPRPKLARSGTTARRERSRRTGLRSRLRRAPGRVAELRSARGTRVARGWVVVGVLFLGGVVVAVAIWRVSGGGVAFVGGLAAVAVALVANIASTVR